MGSYLYYKTSTSLLRMTTDSPTNEMIWEYYYYYLDDYTTKIGKQDRKSLLAKSLGASGVSYGHSCSIASNSLFTEGFTF